MSTRVSKLDLIHVGHGRGSHCVFGMNGYAGYGSIEWAPILIDMLSNKLDKLRMRTEKEGGWTHRMHLQAREFDTLVEVNKGNFH